VLAHTSQGSSQQVRLMNCMTTSPSITACATYIASPDIGLLNIKIHAPVFQLSPKSSLHKRSLPLRIAALNNQVVDDPHAQLSLREMLCDSSHVCTNCIASSHIFQIHTIMQVLILHAKHWVVLPASVCLNPDLNQQVHF